MTKRLLDDPEQLLELAARFLAHPGNPAPFHYREAREVLEKWGHFPTPDRSGETDKTGTGLAVGESGLPEGSSE